MGDPFLGELRIFGFGQAPKGWALCNGQFLPINQNQALFSILGTTYGGNGQTTFALPDLRGRVPIHTGAGFIEGQAGGQEFHTLTQSEMPAHNHFAQAATNQSNTSLPQNNWLGQAGNQYNANASGLTTLAAGTVTNVGGSQPHENRQPFIVLSFCIALIGIFPSRN
jgi:microcystin-dependent protein